MYFVYQLYIHLDTYYLTKVLDVPFILSLAILPCDSVYKNVKREDMAFYAYYCIGLT